MGPDYYSTRAPYRAVKAVLCVDAMHGHSGGRGVLHTSRAGEQEGKGALILFNPSTKNSQVLSWPYLRRVSPVPILNVIPHTYDSIYTILKIIPLRCHRSPLLELCSPRPSEGVILA